MWSKCGLSVGFVQQPEPPTVKSEDVILTPVPHLPIERCFSRNLLLDTLVETLLSWGHFLKSQEGQYK